MLTLGTLLHGHARHRGQHPAVVMGAQVVTYAELRQRAQAISRGLAARGLVPGDRVAVVARHAVDYVSLYFACAESGLTLVPLSYWYRAGELRDTLELAKPALLVHEREFTDLVTAATRELATPLVCVPDGAHEDGVQPASWDVLYGSAESRLPIRRAEPRTPHLMLFTSGTTGRPKGALLSEERTVEGAYGAALALGLRPTDVFIDCLRTFHSGSWDHLKLYFLVGATVVLVRDFDADTVVGKIDSERVSVLLLGGPLLRMLTEAPSYPGSSLESVRLVYGAPPQDGSGLTDAFMARLRSRNPAVEYAATYGLTEFGPYVTVMRSDEVAQNPAAVGRPVPGVRVELVGDDGEPVDPGSPGEVIAYGPSFDGYVDDPEATAAARLGDGLRTGDVAVEDEHGYLTLVDRKKDVIRTGAHNVFSAQVEACLRGVGHIADVAVVPVNDPRLDETVCAVIALDGEDMAVGSDDFADVLRRHVRSQLAGYNVPKYVVAVSELPTNSNGKVLKRQLRDALWDVARTGTSSDPAVTPLWVHAPKDAGRA